MFDLEEQISDWRKQMLEAGIKTCRPLDELENHLREEIGNLMTAGHPAMEAFHIAAARVGTPGRVVAEFRKTGALSSPAIISLVWFGVAAVFLVVLLGRWAEGKMGLLLAAHVFSLTTGYVTAFLAGVFGIYAVCRRRFGSGPGDEAVSLDAAIRWLTLISAGLVFAGLAGGTIWSSQNRGHFFAGDPREIGSLCTVVWLGASALIQRFGGKTGRLRNAQLGIFGNMVVGLAWFGAGAMVHGIGLASYWPLNLGLGVHLFFLGMTVMPGHLAGRNVVES
jgi:hypothetical protein